MLTTFNKMRDQARFALHSFAKLLGEDYGSQPVSCVAQQKANESLNIDLPSFTSLLPYESIDETLLFINKQSAGFGMQIAPAAGADDSLVKAIAQMLKNKLAPNIDCTVLLYKHHYIQNALATSYQPILERGGIYAELAKQSINYHTNAAFNGYKNNRNVPAQLADYCCYLFCAAPSKEAQLQSLRLLRDDLESEFKAIGIQTARVDQEELQVILRTIVSPNLNSLAWPQIDNSNANNISDAIAHPASIYEVDDQNLAISLTDEEGLPINTKVVNCEIVGWSQSFALWQTPDLFANILRSEHGVPCPFVISITIRGTNQEKMKSLAKRKAKSLQKNANAFQTFLNPGMVDEARDWQLVHQEASKDNLHILPVFYNLILFTTKELEREHVAKAIAAYRQQGFTLQQARCTQWLRFLGSLPFILTEGLFNGLKTLGLIKKMTHFNIANLLPIVADFKGSKTGLLLPTCRNQINFLNTFDDKALPITNYNRLTIASPGSGKTLFEQAQILDGLSRGEIIFVIDVGDSYKHLCKLVGGTYIDASTLVLNPFTLFDFEGAVEIDGKKIENHNQIRDLLAIMASPFTPLSDVQRAWLLDAAIISWRKKSTKACMDDVLAALDELMQRERFVGDRRLSDLHLLLSCYGSGGIYGHIFNSATPLLNGSNFVVLEMGALESNKELATIIMFVMIVIIQGQFYHSDRRLKKRCIIDEAWRFLVSGSNPISADFIQQGFRTARKHNGGFAVITQLLTDTSATIQGQAIAASADTKIIMRQGNFQEYIEEHPKAFTPLQQAMISSFGEAKNQGFSEMMIKYGSLSTYHRFFADPFSRVLFSTAGDEFGEIEKMIADGISITEAVKVVAQKYYGDILCD